MVDLHLQRLVSDHVSHGSIRWSTRDGSAGARTHDRGTASKKESAAYQAQAVVTMTGGRQGPQAACSPEWTVSRAGGERAETSCRGGQLVQ